MYLLFADETSVAPSQGPFFMYGGLAIPLDEAEKLHKDVVALLSRNGFDASKIPEDLRPLKFAGKVPEGIDHDKHKLLKQGVIELAIKHKCKLFVIITLHAIVAKAHQRHWGLNNLLRAFEHFLEKVERTTGLVFIDHYHETEEARTLRSVMQERFLRGLVYRGGLFPLTNVLGFAETCIGASHFSSVLDVALGSFRRAVNRRETPEGRSLAPILLRQLAPLFRDKDGKVQVRGRILLEPSRVYSAHLDAYKSLAEFLADNGLRGVLVPGPR